ncbi:MAG: hypothetical protein IPH75_13850 [bacterium]|nr:hypothetical protein [bacterium]
MVILFEIKGNWMQVDLQATMNVVAYAPKFTFPRQSFVYNVLEYSIEDATQPPGNGALFLTANSGSGSNQYAPFLPPGKYRLAFTLENYLYLYNQKNFLPHLSNAECEIGVDITVTITSPSGG